MEIRKTILVYFFMEMMISVACRRDLPFKIPGPTSLDDRIAIVGAGPAGIHMAQAKRIYKCGDTGKNKMVWW